MTSTISGSYRVEAATHRHPDSQDVLTACLTEYEIPYDAFHEAVPDNKGALAGDQLIDDYHGNIGDGLSAGKTGVLMQQPYSDQVAIDGAQAVDSWADVTRLLAWRVRSSPGEIICDYSRYVTV
jgi:hypothetical protein